MKNKFISSVVCALLMSPVFAGNGSNPSGCKVQNVECVKHQFYGAKDYGIWAPEKGAILFYGNGDTTIFRYDDTFQVHLYFTKQAVEWYKANTWAGFEIDIVFPDRGNYTLPRVRLDSVRSSTKGVLPVRDTILGDIKVGTRGITVVKPSNLKVGWNTFSFALKDNIFTDLGENVHMKANIQLVANVSDKIFIGTIFNKNSFLWASYWTNKWLFVYNTGLFVAYNFSGNGEETFKFFAMSGAEQVAKSKLKISSDTVGKGLCWKEGDPTKPAEICDLSNLSDKIGLNSSNELAKKEPSNKSPENSAEKLKKDELKEIVESKTGIDFDENATNPDGGSGEETGLADANVVSVTASKQSNSDYKNTLTVAPGEEMKVKVTFNNKGGAVVENAQVHLYIDGGKKLNIGDDEDWVAEDSDIQERLESGEEVHARIQHVEAPEEKGRYWLHACVWHDTDSDESDITNNCSEDSNEIVELYVGKSTPRPTSTPTPRPTPTPKPKLKPDFAVVDSGTVGKFIEHKNPVIKYTIRNNGVKAHGEICELVRVYPYKKNNSIYGKSFCHDASQTSEFKRTLSEFNPSQGTYRFGNRSIHNVIFCGKYFGFVWRNLKMVL